MSVLATALREHIALRNRIAAEFPGRESARLVLLDLALSRIEGRRVAVSDAKIASGLTGGSGPFAAIARLEAEGLICRTADPDDARRSWLHITDEGFARIEALFCPGSAVARAA